MDFRIKHLIKKSAFLSYIGYTYREFHTKKNIKLFNSLPVDTNKILFASGRYGDSLRAVLEELYSADPKLKFVWAYRSGDEQFIHEYPEYVKPVLFESEAYYKELATSKVWVFNVLAPQGTIKRKEQLYIQVWHGDKPFKRIGNEAAKEIKGYRNQSKGRKYQENELCDYFVTGSKLFIDIWERSMGYRGKVISTGLPRNDILLKENKSRKAEVLKELDLPSDRKILIYAPTFRDHIVDNGKIGTDINLPIVLDTLTEKYQQEWLCLKRSHGGRSLSLYNSNEDIRVIDVSQYRDMTDLMIISDILITDYSSCAGDFAYTEKPVLLYQDDIESYMKKDRGLIFDMKETPFYVAHNMKELLSLISSLNPHDVEENDKAILELYQSTQTAHSTEDVVKIILEHIQTEYKYQN